MNLIKTPVNTCRRWLASSAVAALSLGSAAYAAVDVSPTLAPLKPDLSAQTLNFTVSNPAGSSTITLGSPTFDGDSLNEFSANADACTTLVGGTSCTVSVTYTPVNAASGHRRVMLTLPDSTGAVLASALLTTSEGIANAAARRLPDILTELTVKQAGSTVTRLQSGVATTVNWGQTGYQAGMESVLTVFECNQTTLDGGNCGSSYSSATQSSGFQTATSTTAGNWSYQGTQAQVNSYSWTFTPDCTGDAVVLRFYQRSALDKTAGNTSLSVLIPGGLSGLAASAYYDKEGRRLTLPCTPANPS